MGSGCDRIGETLLIQSRYRYSPEGDVLCVAFQILKEQRVSMVLDFGQFWSREFQGFDEFVWTFCASTCWLVVQRLFNLGHVQSHLYFLVKTNRLRNVVFSNVFQNLFPHCVALVAKLMWTLKPALQTYRMSSRLEIGEFPMSSWHLQFLAEIWKAAKGLLFLVSSMLTSKRSVTAPKAGHFQRLHQSWV